jgi:hypothetical protein
VLAIFVDEYRSRRAGPSAVTAAAAWLVPSEEIAALDRRWRLHLLEHDLPAGEPSAWRRLAGAHKSVRKAARSSVALAELTRAAAGMSGLGFVVTIADGTWNELPSSVRRSFRSPDRLCFLRVMRIVVDRLEGCGQASPFELRMRRDDVGLRDRAEAVEQLLGADTRARDLISLLAFVSPRAAGHFDAIDMVVQTGLSRLQAHIEKGEERAAADPLPFPPSFLLEHWDATFVSQSLESLEWGRLDRPQPPGSRRRKDGDVPAG